MNYNFLYYSFEYELVCTTTILKYHNKVTSARETTSFQLPFSLSEIYLLYKSNN